MFGHHTGSPIRPAPKLVATLGLVAAALTVAASSAGATTSTDRACTVTNTSTHRTFGPGGGWVLRTAIDKARAGSTLEIRGRCVGSFSIDKRLSLAGKRTDRFPVAVLSGDGDGPVVTIGAATVSLSNLLITHTAMPGDDGTARGVLNHGTLTITRSTVAGNGAATGGGIFNDGALKLVRSTVSNNVAGNGAGIYNVGELTIRFSTIGENSSSGDGGGIYSEHDLLLSHSTVGDNVTAWEGGGLYVSGPTTFEASIVSSNLAGASGPECAGEVTSNGYNVIFTTDGFFCAITPTVGDQIGGGVDALLEDLAFHGGSTRTMALPWTSPAIDAIPVGAMGADGVTVLCSTTPVPDQRGVGQPQAGGCDVGAFEKKV